MEYALGKDAAYFFHQVEFAELVGLVGPSEHSFQVVVRIVFKEEKTIPASFSAKSGIARVEVLSRISPREYVLFLERKFAANEAFSRIRHLMPWQINGGDVRITVLGTNEELKKWMSDLENDKIPFKVISLGAASFVPQSPLSELTRKQKDILLKAYRAGYYSIPRKTTPEALASSLGIDRSTIAEHIRKSESILMTRMITDAHLFASDRTAT